jgi:hypothetical protein
MKCLFGAFLLLLTLTACVDKAYVTSTTEVTINYGTRDRNRPARHEAVFSCSSINGLRDYMDYGEADRSCGLRYMTAERKIHWYDSRQFGRVQVYEFMVDGWYYYSFEETRGRRHY